MTAGVVVALVARGILAAVFGFAAFSKLRDRSQTRTQLQAVGLPTNLDMTLVIVEGFTAFGILMETRSAWSTWVALVLLVVFSMFVMRQIATGDNTPCPCFGSGVHDRPTDLWTLARNLILLATAVVATGSTGTGQWLVWLVASVGFALLSGVTAVSSRRAH